MRKDYEKLFTRFALPEPPEGLFDRIILAVKHEQELRNTKRLAFGFLVLLIISLAATPFSLPFFLRQIVESGILQFMSIAINDLGTFLSLWPDSVMAVAESLPVMGIIVFVINMILVVFTLRLFLRRKGLLLRHFYASKIHLKST